MTATGVDYFLEGVLSAFYQRPACCFDLRKTWVSLMLTLDELRICVEALLKYVNLVKIRLHEELEVPMLANLRNLVRKSSDVELNVLQYLRCQCDLCASKGQSLN